MHHRDGSYLNLEFLPGAGGVLPQLASTSRPCRSPTPRPCCCASFFLPLITRLLPLISLGGLAAAAAAPESAPGGEPAGPHCCEPPAPCCCCACEGPAVHAVLGAAAAGRAVAGRGRLPLAACLLLTQPGMALRGLQMPAAMLAPCNPAPAGPAALAASAAPAMRAAEASAAWELPSPAASAWTCAGASPGPSPCVSGAAASCSQLA